MNRVLPILLLLGLILGFGSAQNSHPDFDTHDSEGLRVSSLKDEAATDTNTVFWRGYVRGITDALRISGDICIADTVTPRDLNRAVMEYLESTRGSLHQPAYHSIYRAINLAYPCKN